MSDEQTIATYDRIAAEFARRHWNVDLDAARTRFARAVAGNVPTERFRLLDAGCGPGRDSLWFRERGFQVVGVDLSSGMLAEARKRVPGVEFRQADLRHLDFPDGAFDGIWCSASLLHVPRADVPGVLASFYRLLGHGWLRLSVKAGEGEEVTERVYGPGLARRFTYFTPTELELLLERAGFHVREIAVGEPGPGSDRAESEHPWLTALAQTKLRTPLLAASAIIFDGEGRVLLSERGDGRGWSLPGGFADADEAPDETVVREVREETGLEVAVEQLIGVYTSPPSDSRERRSLVVHSFLCRVVGGELALTTETLQHGWFSPDALPAPMMSHRHVERIHDAIGLRLGQLAPPVFRRHAE